MHFVTGGAYNGKAKWVRNYYSEKAPVQWISAYQDEALPFDFDEDFVVLQGVEMWLRNEVQQQTAEAIRIKWQEIIKRWRIWEEEKKTRCCIIIGADITKGIVPIEACNRTWRDASGWFFQDIAAASSRVDIIWYGIAQQVK